jgi:hypothetical protein
LILVVVVLPLLGLYENIFKALLLLLSLLLVWDKGGKVLLVTIVACSSAFRILARVTQAVDLDGGTGGFDLLVMLLLIFSSFTGEPFISRRANELMSSLVRLLIPEPFSS